jgi:hypothetical protein
MPAAAEAYLALPLVGWRVVGSWVADSQYADEHRVKARVERRQAG